MKAVDPSIKSGAVLTLPGNWPDSVAASGASGDWNQQVLSIAGSAIESAIVHFYPPSSLGASMVNTPDQLGGELAQLRQEINQYAGAHGPGIQVAMARELSASGAPSASNVTDPQATGSWALPSDGQGDKYEVYRQLVRQRAAPAGDLPVLGTRPACAPSARCCRTGG